MGHSRLLGSLFGEYGSHRMAAFVDVVTFVVLGLVRGVLLVAVVGLSLPVRYRIGPWLFTYPEDAPRSETE